MISQHHPIDLAFIQGFKHPISTHHELPIVAQMFRHRPNNLSVPNCKICGINPRTPGKSKDNRYFPCCNQKICKFNNHAFCYCKICKKNNIHYATAGIIRLQCSKCDNPRDPPYHNSRISDPPVHFVAPINSQNRSFSQPILQHRMSLSNSQPILLQLRSPLPNRQRLPMSTLPFIPQP